MSDGCGAVHTVISKALGYADPPMPSIVRRDVWPLIGIQG